MFNLPQENGKIDPNFKENMKKFAAYFNQDSIGYFFPQKAGVSYNMSRDVRAWKTLLSLGVSDCRFWNSRERYGSEI